MSLPQDEATLIPKAELDSFGFIYFAQKTGQGQWWHLSSGRVPSNLACKRIKAPGMQRVINQYGSLCIMLWHLVSYGAAYIFFHRPSQWSFTGKWSNDVQ